jgi:hypothetical protein
MAERLVSTKDYTRGVPQDLIRDALSKIAMRVGEHNADSTFKESCRLLVWAIHEKEISGSTSATFTTQDVRAFSSTFTIWGVTRKTAESIVRVLIKNKPLL